MKMFGAITREHHEWHPSAQLCKRFNVPNPYPDSNLEGVPHFQKDVKKESIYDMSFFPSTAQEVANRRAVDERIAATPSCAPAPVEEQSVKQEDAPTELDRPPVDLFKAIFASDDEEDEKSDSSDAEDAANNADELKDGVGGALDRIMGPTAATPSPSAVQPIKPIKTEPVLTVMDLIPSTSPPPRDSNDAAYGPALPPRTESPGQNTAQLIYIQGTVRSFQLCQCIR
jgi:G patch domain-containing protein 1